MQHFETLFLPSAGESQWLGMKEYCIKTVTKNHTIELHYFSEPPHGDSYYRIIIDSLQLPGFAWGSHFALDPENRYLIFSWMRKEYERKTMIYDMESRNYLLTPDYFYDFRLRDNRLIHIKKTYGSDGVIETVELNTFDFIHSKKWRGIFSE